MLLDYTFEFTVWLEMEDGPEFPLYQFQISLQMIFSAVLSQPR